jgi:hypothetical protein
MPEDPSVLGNLPRSRPGHRSEKRKAAKKASPATGPAAPKASRSTGSKARSSGSKARSGAAAQRAASSSKTRARAGSGSRPAQQARPASTDPVTGAIRLAGQVAGAGLKVAGEVLKRLPGR